MPKAKTEKTKLERKFVFLAILIAGIIIITSLSVAKKSCTEQYRADTVVQAGSAQLSTEIASTDISRMVGLSGRQCIGDDTAMLFVFEDTKNPGIWMKDMNFAIDILWLGEDKKIIYIEKNVSPDTYPKIFYPDSEAQYVIEVQAGLTDQKSISVGQQLRW